MRGVLVAGSTGEAVYLDERERRLLIEGARSVVTGDRLLLAGVGAESTRATLRLHYTAVADATPVPVVIYQVPSQLATIELQAGLIAELARHGNVIGIKDSRGSLAQVGELLGACPAHF